jgi:hypothetical protein
MRLPTELLSALHLGHHALLGFDLAAGSPGFEYFVHLGVLAEEVVDLLDGGSGAVGERLRRLPLMISWSRRRHAMAVRRRSRFKKLRLCHPPKCGEKLVGHCGAGMSREAVELSGCSFTHSSGELFRSRENKPDGR